MTRMKIKLLNHRNSLSLSRVLFFCCSHGGGPSLTVPSMFICSSIEQLWGQFFPFGHTSDSPTCTGGVGVGGGGGLHTAAALCRLSVMSALGC